MPFRITHVCHIACNPHETGKKLDVGRSDEGGENGEDADAIFSELTC